MKDAKVIAARVSRKNNNLPCPYSVPFAQGEAC